MDDRGVLWSFVRRHPYASEGMLSELFGQTVFQSMVGRSEKWLKQVEVKGIGSCYADQREPISTLLDLRRAELARRYAHRVMGRGAALSGLAPGFEADGEFLWKDRWWRIWVDPGGCAPEALGFIQSPPRKFGGEVNDIVLTEDPTRMDSLARQVELTWSGGKKVYVMQVDGKGNRIARPPQYSRKLRRWKPWGKNELEAHIRQRQRRSTKRDSLAEVAKELDEADWALIIEAGNLPLMTRYELAYSQTDDARKLRDTLGRLKKLEERGLLETAKSPIVHDQLENRKIPTSLGMELLMARWGTTITSMRRMHPWPQVVDKKNGRPRYGLDWLEYFGKHHTLTREFALALVYGSRGVSNSIGEVKVQMVTTIGSRLLYRDVRSRRDKRQSGVVKPDGLATVRIRQCGWMDGVSTAAKPVLEKTIWLEIDRGTIPLTRLTAKLDRYALVWERIQTMNPELVWVIEGTPSREASILRMMRERGIPGWTVLMERLVLKEDDPYWTIHKPVSTKMGSLKVGLHYDAIGGMAPWREIWNTIEGVGGLPLLGVQPWRNRRLRRSPPRRGEQHRILHKVG
jgi:hypothetical protein